MSPKFMRLRTHTVAAAVTMAVVVLVGMLMHEQTLDNADKAADAEASSAALPGSVLLDETVVVTFVS